jgi:outer membrane protein insertion porin family
MPSAAPRCGPAAFVARALIAFVATLGFAPSLAVAIEPFIVKDIRVEGVQRTEAGTVF